MSNYWDNRMGKQNVRGMCRQCLGAGELAKMVLEGMQVQLRMVPCRCREGVTA